MVEQWAVHLVEWQLQPPGNRGAPPARGGELCVRDYLWQ